MANDLKETRHAPAAKAEISQVTTGEASQSPRDADAPYRGLPTLQEPAPGASRLPDLRDLPGPRSDRDAGAGTGKLTTPPAAMTHFIALNDPVHADRAFVFPGDRKSVV